jgi:hypothetical protein
MGKKSGSGSGMNKPDHISKSLETIFWVKILTFFCGSGIQDLGSRIWDGKNSDPGWKKFGSGMEKIRIRDPGGKKFVSGINIPDP